jgi:hypothetical protein
MSIQNNAIVTSAPDTSGACPQNPTVGPHGGYSFDMAQNSGFGATPYYPLWPVPQTYGVEIDIPVVSSQHLGGSNSATAAVTMADGNFDPTLLPSVPLPATSGSTAGTNTAGTPSVINPQVTNITDHSATVQALVVNNYTDGTIETRYGTAVPYPYDQQLTDVASARTYQIERATAIDGLQPGCTYHWAIDLYSLNQIKATVADQTFTTLGTNTGSCAIGASTGSATGNHSFIYTTQPNAHAASTGTIGAPGTAPTPNVTLPQPQQQTGGGGGTPTGGGGSGDPGGGTTPNQPGGDGGGGSTTVVPAFSALALPAVQRGSALKLGLTIGTDGSAVSIKLYTPVVKRSGHNKKTSLVLAGKLARSGVGAGAQNFKVALNAAGKKLLKAHHKLALTVDVAVTPPGGKALTAKRKATLKR